MVSIFIFTSMNYRRNRSRSPLDSSKRSPKVNILFKNIPYSLTWKDIKDLIMEKGLYILICYILFIIIMIMILVDP